MLILQYNSFYRYRNWGTERASNISKSTHPEIEEIKIQAQAVTKDYIILDSKRI